MIPARLAAMERAQQEPSQRPSNKSLLSLFDTTNLVIGAAVGADIYVVAALGALFLGPAVIIAWLVGGLMAIAIALSFAQCALIVPRAGGSYAYAREAFGDLPGFIAGWCLYLGQIVGISVFPLAFTRYLASLLPGLTGPWEVLTRFLFVFLITATNYIGIKAAGKTNDALTLGKLFPLLLLIGLGIPWIFFNPEMVKANITPFAPLGWAGFFAALNPIFWAYAGFEVAPLPADEVRNPQRTLPLALGWGMLIVTIIYVLINAVVVAVVPWEELAASQVPLVNTAATLFLNFGLSGELAAALMVAGAAVSIGGAGESITLAASRLGYQMAVDGYFPRILARRSSRFDTPAGAIVLEGVVMFVLSFLGSIELLIAGSILYLSLVYLGTSLAAFKLARQYHGKRMAVPFSGLIVPLAMISSIVLVIASAPQAWLIGLIGLALAVPFYFRVSPKTAIPRLQAELASEEHILRVIEQFSRQALANFLQIARRLWRRIF